MSILPSVLSAATQEADLTEIQEAAIAKENDSRIWQMLLFVGLRFLRSLTTVFTIHLELRKNQKQTIRSTQTV